MSAEQATNDPQETKPEENQEDIVDPWNVASSSSTGVNYEKLIGNLNT